MKIRVWVIALLFSAICVSTKAQVDKQVEVTKRYIPSIEPTQKLTLQPDMSDTVRIRPEIDYSITPRSIETTLTPKLYKPAKVTFWEFNRPKKYYIKAGVGAPISSVADVYISNFNPNTNYFLAYLNHEGEYAKIQNDYGDRLSTKNTQNRVGGVAGVYIGEQILHGELRYDYDTWSRYATQNPHNTHPRYQTISLASSYGDQFVEFKRWQYLLSLDANYFTNASGDNSYTLGANVKFGGKLRKGKLITNIGYSYIGSNYKYKNNSALLSSIYDFTVGSFDIDLGAKYIFDYLSTDIAPSYEHYIIPQIKVKYIKNHSIQPYVSAGGDIQRNNYAALTQINPYVAEGEYGYKNSVEYSLKLGASGVLGDNKFSYDMFVDYATTMDALLWALVEEEYSAGKVDNYYTAKSATLRALSINAHCDYRPIESLSLKLGARATDWGSIKAVEMENGRTNADIYLGAEHTIKALRYGLSANFESKRYTTLITNATQKSVENPATVNLKAFMEVSLKNKMVLFIEGENLANADIYEWMGYRKYGINATAGIKMQF